MGRFGYTDDTGILCIGHSLETTADRASRYISELVTWGAANGIRFDPAKTDGLHFCRTKPKVSLSVFHGGERLPDETMRWLGIRLDSTLMFKTHVENVKIGAQVDRDTPSAWNGISFDREIGGRGAGRGAPLARACKYQTWPVSKRYEKSRPSLCRASAAPWRRGVVRRANQPTFESAHERWLLGNPACSSVL
ncbi:hypothetical protein Purlil1_12544 [Purpureocillium lilacinum]|uniref:Reverse transcriptase domain-containing protein n=1 Tax=Purpureocillium lilacinum TaxID=33203 RepID=A0ABR0BGL3_PURLI|nr:hypothetical protein Purlil1_12544 [Purpureocillium lilacinum]